MSEVGKWCCGPDGRPDFKKRKMFRDRNDRRSRFDAAGWALFFIWVGISWLADVGLSIGLLGVAVIILGMQGFRKAYGVPIEGFWTIVGIGFAIAGVWQSLGITMPLAPFILIAAGIGLLIWRVLPRVQH